MAVDVSHAIDELCALPVDDRLKVVAAVWDSLPEETAVEVCDRRSRNICVSD